MSGLMIPSDNSLWCRKDNRHAQYYVRSCGENTVYFQSPDCKRTQSMTLTAWHKYMHEAIPEDFEIF